MRFEIARFEVRGRVQRADLAIERRDDVFGDRNRDVGIRDDDEVVTPDVSDEVLRRTEPADGLHACAPVVVGAFPKAHLELVVEHPTVAGDAPEPLAAQAVDEP